MYKIAIYGKGGIGKSTTASNISAALSTLGYKVLQIGCDPKADSVKNLMGGRKIPTVLDMLKEKDEISLNEIVYSGFNGVKCAEAGGPTPGIGCAGRGIITAFDELERLEAYNTYNPDVVLYDVLGDVVCGGFAMPIRQGYADNVFIVTSGEIMALYAASNIVTAINNFGNRGYAKYSGIILNSRNVENEVSAVQQTVDEIGGSIVHIVPRDKIVQEAESKGMTVVEAFPESDMSKEYIMLAKKMMQICGGEDE